MAQTFRRDEVRARTFNTRPLYFPFVANILRQRDRHFNLTLNFTSYHEMLRSIGIKKEE